LIANQPGDELAEVRLLGCPWHGKVQGGLVHLPNATTMAWPQPDGTMTDGFGVHFRWHKGFTFRQSMPWAEAPVRSEEAAEDDAANGRQFLTSAILAGARGKVGDTEPYLHSKGISGWLYAAPDDTVWKMNTMGPWSWTSGPLSLNLNPRRFGAFGVEDTIHNFTVTATAAAMQQTTPALVASGGFGARVTDITPDGKKAVIMLYRLFSTGLDVEPVGFLLLTLSGIPGINFNAVITVLASRLTTLGTVTSTDGITRENKFQGVRSDTPAVVDDTTAYPACGGHVTRTWAMTPVVLTPGGGITSNSLIASGEDVRRVIDRIVGYWFDETAAPFPVYLQVDRTFSCDIPAYTITPGDPLIRRKDNAPGSGVCVLGTEYTHQVGTYSYSRYAEALDHLEWKLQWKGFEVTHVIEIAETLDISESGTVSALIGSDVAQGGVTGGSGISSSGHGSTWGTALDAEIQSHLGGSAVIEVLSVLEDESIGFSKWSNNLYGIVLFDVVSNQYDHRAIHTFGEIGSTVSASFNAYGSLNPITGEAVINSSTPVSWT
jgi:hypothetical protein